jgi:hypothetical protein
MTKQSTAVMTTSTATNHNGTRLHGKVALITGGARGMGASFARAMVAQGANVMITDVLDDAGNKLAASLGNHAAYRRLDVTRRDDWKAAVEDTVRTFGKLNVLVNNAGVVNFAPIDRNDEGSNAERRPHRRIQRHQSVVDCTQAGSTIVDHQHLVHGGSAWLSQPHGIQRSQIRVARTHQVGCPGSCIGKDSLQLGTPRCHRHTDVGRPRRCQEASANATSGQAR